jgi:CRISPR system Cascade subunit CasC
LVINWIINDKKPTTIEVQEALNQNKENQSHAIDVALFGRMVAKAPDLNADASAQVAHAISTHRVDNEFDYFTAVDDFAPKDNAGAGMIGTVEYNSSTLYRYATVAAHELLIQLAGDAAVSANAIKEFARAFITSMPTGKQNTFANRTVPEGVVVTIREDQPINLVGAFESPISAKGEGFSKDSIAQLSAHAKETYDNYFGEPKKTWVIGGGLSGLGETTNLPSLLTALEETLALIFSELKNAAEV